MDTYIPKVMFLCDAGYRPYQLEDSKGGRILSKKLRNLVLVKDRLVYKVYNCGFPRHLWGVIDSGFFGMVVPGFRGVLFDGEKEVGYVMDECITLNMNRAEIDRLREKLKDAFLKTGWIFADFLPTNMAMTRSGPTILDLESVNMCGKTKDLAYQNFITANLVNSTIQHTTIFCVNAGW